MVLRPSQLSWPVPFVMETRSCLLVKDFFVLLVFPMWYRYYTWQLLYIHLVRDFAFVLPHPVLLPFVLLFHSFCHTSFLTSSYVSLLSLLFLSCCLFISPTSTWSNIHAAWEQLWVFLYLCSPPCLRSELLPMQAVNHWLHKPPRVATSFFLYFFLLLSLSSLNTLLC